MKNDETTAKNSQTTEPNETEAPKNTLPINPDDFYFCKVFELPEDFRTATVENMKKAANVEWVATKDFGTIMTDRFGINLHFEAGKKYLGIPYANTRVCVNEVEYIFVDGKYTCESSNWDEVAGLQCVSSIMSSIQAFTPMDGPSYPFLPGHKDFGCLTVGDYKYSDNMMTGEMCETNGKDKMYECYALLDKGDIIISSNQYVHLRVVCEKPTIVYTPDGKINHRRSYVKTVEQTNQFDKEIKERSNSTWWVDHTYTFEQLFETTYVPVTLKEYQTGVAEIPYIALTDEITPEILAKGSLSGQIKSNYPLWFIRYDIKDENGNSVKTYTKRNIYNTFSITNRNMAHELFDGTLESGKYTFVLTASTSQYKTQICEVQFEYNK